MRNHKIYFIFQSSKEPVVDVLSERSIEDAVPKALSSFSP